MNDFTPSISNVESLSSIQNQTMQLPYLRSSCRGLPQAVEHEAFERFRIGTLKHSFPEILRC